VCCGGVGGWGGCGEGTGEGAVTLPRKIFDFGSQDGEFWCILGGIFYSSAIYLFYTQNRCNLVSLPIYFFSLQKGPTWFIFLHFGVGKSSMPPDYYERRLL